MAPFAETPIMSFRETPTVEVFKEPDLLDGWWTSEKLFSLERRAVFSTTWICITHQSRFTKAGDYISLEFAGVPILIILGKDGISRAFHNVCRHRAYTITKKPAGSSLVLGCRYHGWSYDTKGNLVKAPQFDGLEGFDRSENGLFGIQTCIDRAGFIHINLDSRGNLRAPDVEGLIEFSFDHAISQASKWLTGWELNGSFNWKTESGSYRHNNSAGASDRTGIGTSLISIPGAFSVDSLINMFRRPAFTTDGCEVFLIGPKTIIVAFPKSSIWAMMTGLPVSAAQTTIKCDIFGNARASLSTDDEATLREYFAARVQSLEHEYERTKFFRFDGGSKQLHILKAHLQNERLEGREISPSKRLGGRSESFCKAEKLCNELDFRAKSSKTLGHGRLGSVQGGLEW